MTTPPLSPSIPTRPIRRTMPRAHHLLLLVPIILTACSPSQDQGPDERYANQVVTRKDRNNDGHYDYELHRFPAGAEPNYELIDTDHDGTYDQKITYGYTIRHQTISEPVPGTRASTTAGGPRRTHTTPHPPRPHLQRLIPYSEKKHPHRQLPNTPSP